MRISTYIHFAELIYKRNWSAEKRQSTAAGNTPLFKGENESNIEKYSYFDGAKASMPWCSNPFTTMSDREEARAVLAYAKKLFIECAQPTPIDKEDYAALLEAEKRMKN